MDIDKMVRALRNPPLPHWTYPGFAEVATLLDTSAALRSIDERIRIDCEMYLIYVFEKGREESEPCILLNPEDENGLEIALLWEVESASRFRLCEESVFCSFHEAPGVLDTIVRIFIGLMKNGESQ